MKENVKKTALWFEAIFREMRPKPANSAKRAEKHSKESPINITVGKSGVLVRLVQTLGLI